MRSFSIKRPGLKRLVSIPVILLLSTIVNCSGGGGSSINGHENQEFKEITLSGVAQAGPMRGKIEVYKMTLQGEKGELIATGKSGADGKFSIKLTSLNEPLFIVIKDCEYTDEQTGELVLCGNEEMRALIPHANASQEIGVTPLSNHVAELASRSIVSETGRDKADVAVEKASQMVAELFGVDAETVKAVPAPPSESGSENPSKKAALALRVLSQAMKAAKINPSHGGNPLRALRALARESAVNHRLSGETLGETVEEKNIKALAAEWANSMAEAKEQVLSSQTINSEVSGWGVPRAEMREPNRPPRVMSEERIAVVEDKPKNSLSAEDPDRDRISFKIVKQPQFGIVGFVNKNRGTFQYVSNTNRFGADKFDVLANDGKLDSAVVTINLFRVPKNGVFENNCYLEGEPVAEMTGGTGYCLADGKFYVSGVAQPGLDSMGTGFGVDEKYYKMGMLGTSLVNGKYYKEGVLASGEYEGKLYDRGEIASGIFGNRYYSQGVLGSGKYQDKVYDKGVPVTGTYENEHYSNGIKVKSGFAGEVGTKEQHGTPCDPLPGEVSEDLGTGSCTGNYVVQISIPHFGKFIHNSNANLIDRGFGVGFDFELERRILSDGAGGYFLQEGNGTRVPLIKNGTDSAIYRAADLRRNENLFKISSDETWEKSPFGELYTFKATLRSGGFELKSYRDRNLRETTYDRDDQGKLLAITNSYGERQGFSYDSEGILDSVRDIGGNEYDVQTKKRNGLVYLTAVKTPDRSHLWKLGYDAKSRIVLVVSPVGAEERAAYDAKGNLTGVLDANNYEIVIAYTNSSVERQDSFSSEGEYFANGLLSGKSDENGETKLIRDGLGRVEKEVRPDKTEVLYSYLCGSSMFGKCEENDPRKYLITEEKRTNGTSVKSKSYSYNCSAPDNRCDIVSATDEGGVKTESSYTQSEPYHLPLIRNANGKMITYEYDNRGNLTKTTTPFGMASKVYNADGSVQSETDMFGRRTLYQYDGKGRVVQKTDYLGRVTQTGYDSVGQVNSLVTPTSTWTGSRDVAGRAIKQESQTQGTLKSQLNQTSMYDSSNGKVIKTTTERRAGNAIYSQTKTFDPSRGYATQTGETFSSPTVNSMVVRDGQNNLVPQSGLTPGE